jgi:hypothetical protein
MKIQKKNHAERRALFLSKLQAPPSLAATMTPTTPPESPAIFHYTLPSPGLTSPFTVFESVDKDRCEGWVETVYFEKHDNDDILAEKQNSPPKVPSLQQISARMMPSTINVESCDSTPTINTSRPLVGVGRLRMPLRTSQPRPHAALAPQS